MNLQLRPAAHQFGEKGAQGDRQVVILVPLLAGAEQGRAAVDIPADDEDFMLGLQQGAAHRQEEFGSVDQHLGAAAIGDAPAAVA